MSVDLANLNGYRWIPNGQSQFSGDFLKLFRSLDDHFTNLSKLVNALEHQFPVFIQAKELRKLDYFKSFPHLVTFPVVLNDSKENLKKFTEGSMCDAEGKLHLTDLSPICDCLTPAACYHFYIHYQGSNFTEAKYLTTRANCFRREERYQPLQRQWNFNMREIVCIGTADEVKSFIAQYKDILTSFFSKIGLPVKWEIATDPFFDPSNSPKFLMQTIDPVKEEMIFNGSLSIGSTNFHKNYFGEAFGITRDGETAFSGCVAFGLERWIFAFLTIYAEDPKNWPLKELLRE